MSAERPTRARVTLSWGLLDQIVASGSTFVFVMIAAKALSASELGAIAFAFELYLLSVFAARGVSGDPLTSRFSGLDAERLRKPVQAAATSAVLMGAGLGVIVAAGAWFADPPLRHVLLVAAVALPGLALQDFVRSALIVQGRVRATFCNDTFWAVGQLPAMGLAILIHPTAPVVLGAWAATGCAAALLGLWQLQCRVSPLRSLREWLRDTRDLWPYYLADNLVYELTSLSFLFVISVTAGLAAMAGFRVAMTMYAPLSLVARGIISVTVAMLARRRDDPAQVRSRAMLISFVLTPLALGWGFVMLLVPTAVGEALFGASWREAEPLLFLASFVCAGGLFSTGTIIGMRALGAGRHTLAGRLVVAVGGGTAAALGGILGDAHGVFVGLAWFFPVQAVMWWSLLRHAARQAQARIRSGEGLYVQ